MLERLPESAADLNKNGLLPDWEGGRFCSQIKQCQNSVPIRNPIVRGVLGTI